MSLDVPVVFLIFNRPAMTQRVFERIAQARPSTLLVVADGPSDKRPEDHKQVALTRSIIDKIDWPCELLTNYSDKNLGCKNRVSSGLDWAFEMVEEAIVLEDDCLPDPSFFGYCRDLLERYRDDDRIVSISGNNFQTDRHWTPYSYFFSRYFQCWGWASWRRAWKHFDLAMPTWPEFRKNRGLQYVTDSQEEERYWQNIFEKEYRGLIDTWDFATMYAFWSQNGLCILPEENLISNIGFGDGATHTIQKDSPQADGPTGEMGKLIHPPYTIRHKEADRFIFNHWFSPVKRKRTWDSFVRKYAHSINKRLPKKLLRPAA